MPPDDRDAARLWDMLTYANEIRATLAGIRFVTYMADKTLRLATERRIEIIGEAARNVSPVFQQAHPEIPWQKIVAMRHVLAHEYGEVKQETVFRVVTLHIPQMIAQLKPLVPSLDVDAEDAQ
jgi:uncharacterized protein with HEPN domain